HVLMTGAAQQVEHEDRPNPPAWCCALGLCRLQQARQRHAPEQRQRSHSHQLAAGDPVTEPPPPTQNPQHGASLAQTGRARNSTISLSIEGTIADGQGETAGCWRAGWGHPPGSSAHGGGWEAGAAPTRKPRLVLVSNPFCRVLRVVCC